MWKPSDYGGIRELVIPPSSIWLPDFGIANRSVLMAGFDTDRWRSTSNDTAPRLYKCISVCVSVCAQFETAQVDYLANSIEGADVLWPL